MFLSSSDVESMASMQVTNEKEGEIEMSITIADIRNDKKKKREAEMAATRAASGFTEPSTASKVKSIMKTGSKAEVGDSGRTVVTNQFGAGIRTNSMHSDQKKRTLLLSPSSAGAAPPPIGKQLSKTAAFDQDLADSLCAATGYDYVENTGFSGMMTGSFSLAANRNQIHRLHSQNRLSSLAVGARGGTSQVEGEIDFEIEKLFSSDPTTARDVGGQIQRPISAMRSNASNTGTVAFSSLRRDSPKDDDPRAVSPRSNDGPPKTDTVRDSPAESEDEKNAVSKEPTPEPEPMVNKQSIRKTVLDKFRWEKRDTSTSKVSHGKRMSLRRSNKSRASSVAMDPFKGWGVIKNAIFLRSGSVDIKDKFEVRRSLDLSPSNKARKKKTARSKAARSSQREENACDGQKTLLKRLQSMVMGPKTRKDIFDVKMYESAFDLEKVSFEFFEIRETDPDQITETAKYQIVTQAPIDDDALSWFNRTFIQKEGWVIRQSSSSVPDTFFLFSFWLTWWNVWFVLFYLGFAKVWPDHVNTWHVDLVGELIYFVGVVILPLRTSVLNLEDGREYLDLQYIWHIISRSTMYRVGLLTCLSWLWWFDDTGSETIWSWFGALRLLRIWGALKWKSQKVIDRASSSVILQSVATNLMLEIVFGTHILAVIWFRASWHVFGNRTYGLNPNVHSIVDYYLLSMRDCILLLGGSPPPAMSMSSNVLLASIVGLASPLCIVLIAIVLADIVLIKQSYNILQTRIVEEKSLVNATMTALGLPPLLKSRIIEYQRFVDLQFGNEGARNNLYSRMNALLELEVKIYLFSGLIERAPFFSNIHAWGIAEIIANFCEEFYSPGDFVIRLGQEGREMYFILKGRCEILVRDEDKIEQWQIENPEQQMRHFPKKVITAKNAGDYFGEVALVKAGAIRTAYVRAQTYCVLEKLHGHVLHSVVRNKFPEAYTEIVQRILGFSNIVENKNTPPAGGESSTTPTTEQPIAVGAALPDNVLSRFSQSPKAGRTKKSMSRLTSGSGIGTGGRRSMAGPGAFSRLWRSSVSNEDDPVVNSEQATRNLAQMQAQSQVKENNRNESSEPGRLSMAGPF